MITSIEQGIEILKKGGVIIFPTDTAFGIGCRVDNEQSVARLFSLRRRPAEKATPVLVSSPGMAQTYWRPPLSGRVQQLMQTYWPGALTIVYPCQTEKIPTLVRGGGTTVGLRMPKNEVTVSLIEGVGVPILGPSANFHGQQTPFSLSDLDPELVSLVDGVVDGTCSAGNVSTVVDCSVEPFKIIRQGAVTLEM